MEIIWFLWFEVLIQVSDHLKVIKSTIHCLSVNSLAHRTLKMCSFSKHVSQKRSGGDVITVSMLICLTIFFLAFAFMLKFMVEHMASSPDISSFFLSQQTLSFPNLFFVFSPSLYMYGVFPAVLRSAEGLTPDSGLEANSRECRPTKSNWQLDFECSHYEINIRTHSFYFYHLNLFHKLKNFHFPVSLQRS